MAAATSTPLRGSDFAQLPAGEGARRLSRNEAPIEAAVYCDDMYVDAQLSLETASHVAGLHAWITNEFEHDELRLGDVAERLFTALEARIVGSRS